MLVSTYTASTLFFSHFGQASRLTDRIPKQKSGNMAAIVDRSAAADFAMPCTCERCAPQTADLRPPTRDERRRFLGASSGDAGKAAHLLTKTLVWRRDNNIDALTKLARDGPATEEDREELANEAKVDALYPCALLPTGYDGTCLQVQMLGRADVGGLLDDVGEERALRASTLRNERALLLGKRVLVLDMEGLSPSTLRGLPTFKRLIDIMQRHYPGSVSRILVVNCPLLVWTAYKVVQPWLAPETAERVALFSWREAPDFGDLVAHECLPARYGGARACPRLDELCAARDAA